MLQLTIVGAIGADAVKREANGHSFISFNVASSERYTKSDGTSVDNTTWISCTLNGDGGKLLRYLVKGATVICTGRASTRLYSSPKEKRMVAGLNLSVDIIELVGGKPDAVPSRLADANGVLHPVHKAFYVEENPQAPFFPASGSVAFLYAERGGTYLLNEFGFVAPNNMTDDARGEGEQSVDATTTVESIAVGASEQAEPSEAPACSDKKPKGRKGSE